MKSTTIKFLTLTLLATNFNYALTCNATLTALKLAAVFAMPIIDNKEKKSLAPIILGVPGKTFTNKTTTPTRTKPFIPARTGARSKD